MFNLHQVLSDSDITVCKSLHDSYIVEQIQLLYDNDFIKNSMYTAEIKFDHVLLTTIELFDKDKYPEWLAEKINIFDRYSDMREYIVSHIGLPLIVDSYSESLKLSETPGVGYIKFMLKGIELLLPTKKSHTFNLSQRLDGSSMKIVTVKNEKKERYDKILKDCDKFVENALRVYNKK